MKKFLTSAVTTGLMLAAGPAYAIESAPNLEPISGGVDLRQLIFNVINYILFVGGALAVLFLIIGGIRYIISAGREDEVEAARNTIFNAIIGIVIVLIALVIVTTINNLVRGAQPK